MERPPLTVDLAEAQVGYVHGYSGREAERLHDQAQAVGSLLHDGLRYAAGRRVLECGCGTGAQTGFLTAGSPGAHLVSVDLSLASLRRARDAVSADGAFAAADLFALPVADASFDDVFVCFVLEHLADPVAGLAALQRVLRPGGTLTVIEGDHGSWYAHPQTAAAAAVVQCLVDVQAKLGGDGLIGRRLFPLLQAAGYDEVAVLPRMVYVDDSRPDLVEAFSRDTFIAMVSGAREQALDFGLTDGAAWKQGIADLHRATERGGTFCYTFFRATAIRGSDH